MKRIMLSMLLATAGVSAIDTSTSNQDWTVDLANSCVYQDPKTLVIGDTTCNAYDHLLIVKEAAKTALHIDALSTPTTNTAGALRIQQQAAAEGVSGINYFGDINGFSSTSFINAYILLSGLEGGDVSAPDLRLIDTTGSTGGVSSGINVQRIGSGSALVAAVLAGTGTFPVVTLTGTLPVGPEQAWRETSGPTFTDSTTAFGSTSTDVQIFVNQNDYIYVGSDTTYFEIQVALAIASSNNIAAVFEYSTAAGWTQFFPTDGTSGFTRGGVINWNKADLLSGGWAARSVNGVSKYYIRIQRTRASLATPPTEDSIFITDGAVNQWDNEGRITIQQLTAQGSGTNNIGGRLKLTGVVTSHTTCDANAVGLIEMFDNGANKTSLCVCERTGAGTYAWGAATAGGSC